MTEPILSTRRQFLTTGMMGLAASSTLPSFLNQTALALNQQGSTSNEHPVLVVLQMGGGNDGLNTVIPFADDLYHKARPRLAIGKKNQLPIDEHLALNGVMQSFKELYDQGSLAIVNGVGYPNPNRSHFRSMEIWHTASDSDKNVHYGWLGRYFDNTCQGEDPSVGINIGNQSPRAFLAHKPQGITMASPETYRFLGEESERDSDPTDDRSGDSIGQLSGNASPTSATDNLAFLQRVSLDAHISSDQINTIASSTRNKTEYPNSKLARDLATVAKLISGGVPTRIFYVSQGGYDTHARQQNSHNNLLRDMAQSIAAFCKDLRTQNVLDRVLIMTFSEFGRRVQENASMGTDHGKAGPMFLIGGKIKPGLYSKYPRLDALDKGDLKFSVDFRSVYATILRQWLHADDQAILGRTFPRLDFV